MKRARQIGLVLALGLVGCASVYEMRVKSRDNLLGQLRDDLENDVGPKYRVYLEADTGRDPALRENDWALVVDMDRSIARATSATVALSTTQLHLKTK